MKSIAWNTEDFKIELTKRPENIADLKITTSSGATVLHKPITRRDLEGIRNILFDILQELDMDIEEQREFDKSVQIAMQGPITEPKYYEGDPGFDWKSFIQSVESGAISTRDHKEWEKAEALAEVPQTSPLGQMLSPEIPRDSTGAVTDHQLQLDGNRFHNAVVQRNIKSMRRILKKIAEREKFVLSIKKAKEEVKNG